MEEVNKNTEVDNTDKKLHISGVRSSNSNKIRLEQIDPMGNVIDTIELTGRWLITTGDKSYFMTSKYVDEMKVDLENIQKNFMDNL
jgi:hypothetical protein